MKMHAPGMTEAAVLAVLDALAEAGSRVWVAGGWGVDALVGRQTRVHRDLDLTVDALDEQDVLAALTRLGSVIETDWRPVRVELAAAGQRWVDVHPVTFDDYGNGTQPDLEGGTFFYPVEAFAVGRIGGRDVGCLSVAQQLRFHRGYEPRDVDRADMAMLEQLLASERASGPHR